MTATVPWTPEDWDVLAARSADLKQLAKTLSADLADAEVMDTWQADRALTGERPAWSAEADRRSYVRQFART